MPEVLQRAGSRMDTSQPVVVTGAGGFIGGHLVGDLLASGFEKSWA